MCPITATESTFLILACDKCYFPFDFPEDGGISLLKWLPHGVSTLSLAIALLMSTSAAFMTTILMPASLPVLILFWVWTGVAYSWVT